MAMVSMQLHETKKCRIVPKQYNYIPDLLLQNKRIEEETTMDLNPKEIQRAMMLADVFAIGDDESETLLTPKNFYLKEDEEAVEDEEEEEEDTHTVEKKVEPVTKKEAAPVKEEKEEEKKEDSK